MFPSNAGRSTPGTVLDRWFRRNQHPDAFVCGVRVVEGAVPGEGSRWRFRSSAVDRFRPDDAVRMRHGDVPLTVRVDAGPPTPGRRHRHAIITATVVDTGARVELSVPLGDLVALGVDV